MKKFMIIITLILFSSTLLQSNELVTPDGVFSKRPEDGNKFFAGQFLINSDKNFLKWYFTHADLSGFDNKNAFKYFYNYKIINPDLKKDFNKEIQILLQHGKLDSRERFILYKLIGDKNNAMLHYKQSIKQDENLYQEELKNSIKFNSNHHLEMAEGSRAWQFITEYENKLIEQTLQFPRKIDMKPITVKMRKYYFYSYKKKYYNSNFTKRYFELLMIENNKKLLDEFFQNESLLPPGINQLFFSKEKINFIIQWLNTYKKWFKTPGFQKYLLGKINEIKKIRPSCKRVDHTMNKCIN